MSPLRGIETTDQDSRAGRVPARTLAARSLVRAARRLSPDTTWLAQPADRISIAFGVYRKPEGSRWGWERPRHRQLEEMLARSADSYRSTLGNIERYGAQLAQIDRAGRNESEPRWYNPTFLGLDAASLYYHLRERSPSRYVEIGSGFSTKFAHRAKRDGDLKTEIVSIDPEPRSEIDDICDTVIRDPLEHVDQELFRRLGPSDVVLFDGSHRVLTGNDVVVFFLEILPQLPPGVLVGVHDIFLPDDYAPAVLERHWNEQYMLGAVLLAGSARYEIVLPCHYVATTPPLQSDLEARWEAMGLSDTLAWGSAFWIQVVSA